MSWTSEHDPPSDPRAEGAAPGWFGDARTADGPADEAAPSDADDLDDLDDEGPLDPSVFDGLFADLTPEPADHRADEDDNPLEAFLASPLTGDGWDAAPTEPDDRPLDDLIPTEPGAEAPAVDGLDLPPAPPQDDLPEPSYDDLPSIDDLFDDLLDDDRLDDDRLEDDHLPSRGVVDDRAEHEGWSGESAGDRDAWLEPGGGDATVVGFEPDGPPPGVPDLPIEPSQESALADQRPPDLLPVEPMPVEDLLRPIPEPEANGRVVDRIDHLDLDDLDFDVVDRIEVVEPDVEDRETEAHPDVDDLYDHDDHRAEQYTEHRVDDLYDQRDPNDHRAEQYTKHRVDDLYDQRDPNDPWAERYVERRVDDPYDRRDHRAERYDDRPHHVEHDDVPRYGARQFDASQFDGQRFDVSPYDEPRYDEPRYDEPPYEAEPFARLDHPVDHDLRRIGPDPGLDGPRRASPPIQPDTEAYPDLIPGHAPPDASIAQQEAVRPRPRARLTVVAAAVLIGGVLGIGGAILMASIGRGSDDGGESAASPAAVAPADGDASGDPAPAGAVATPLIQGLELSSLRFDPGAEPIRLADTPAVELLARAIAEAPSAPITATVRSFGEPTAAADLALSIRQAEALEAQLVELGAPPDRVTVVGVGRSLLSPAQPVPNFVVASAGLDRSELRDLTRRIGPFAIGIDRTTGELRAESRQALTELAQAMVDDSEQRSLTLAAYSYDQPDSAANDRQAELAASAAADYLVASGVDPARVTVIVPGDEPYAVTDEVASHIDLRLGPEATFNLALDGLGIDEVDFEAGSAELSPAGEATIDGLASLLLSSPVAAVIDVHSFDGEDLDASVGLSVLRAQAIGQHLVDAGVPAQLLRLHGGASPQFRSEPRSARVVVTLVATPQ